MQRLSEQSRMITALAPQALNNTNITSRYVAFSKSGYLRAWLLGGAAAATKTTKIELLQATDVAGTSAKAINDQGAVAVAATMTANLLASEVTVALSAVANTDYITINTLRYTKAAATSAALREFADAAGLVTCVNHATYGVRGVFASAQTTTVTLRSEPMGETAITAVETNVGGTITVATTIAQAFVDIQAGLMDDANGFLYLAAKITTTANSVVAVVFDFYPYRWTPTQAVGASDIA
jgi:hypothetical protein